MRAVVQRVGDCSVDVEGKRISSIRRGLLIYLGVTHSDGPDDVEYMAEKIANLRIFPDQNGKMNLSARDLEYEALVVSQFTLYGDVKKGRRPSYDQAAPPAQAETLYTDFIHRLSDIGLPSYGGQFQAVMEVRYVNEGPVTILVDSEKKF